MIFMVNVLLLFGIGLCVLSILSTLEDLNLEIFLKKLFKEEAIKMGEEK